MSVEMEHEFINFGHIYTNICYRTGTLLVSYLASKLKLDELSESPGWYDESLDWSGNKQRMKEAGGVVMGYAKFLRQMTVIGIATLAEDLLADLKEVLSIDLKFREISPDVKFYDDMKFVRHMSNVIKHCRGIVLSDGSRSGEALIRDYGVTPGSEIEFLSLSLDLEAEIIKAFRFQHDLLCIELRMENSWEQKEESEIPAMVRNLLVPDLLQL